jgi:hypothetical protein
MWLLTQQALNITDPFILESWERQGELNYFADIN